MKTHTCLFLAAVIGFAPAIPASAQQDEAGEVAKKLANPVASLISVPLQYNYDKGYGPDDEGSVHLLSIQPVIPISLNDKWNIITRTIVPLIDQRDIPAEGRHDSGLGDIVASLFLSPKAPAAGGWIWGAGPVFLLPTATDGRLGGKKWGVGPTAVVLNQKGPWTVGLLANHIWSVAGKDDRADVNATFLQPFLSYTTKTMTTFAVVSESTYDWANKAWSVPVIPIVGQLFKIGPQILQLAVAGKYWAESPDNGPSGWGARVQLTFVFPK